MTNHEKQNIIGRVTQLLARRPWFNGAGFPDKDNTDKLIIAFNYLPILEMKEFKEAMLGIQCEYELRDIKNLQPNNHRDDVPSHIPRTMYE